MTSLITGMKPKTVSQRSRRIRFQEGQGFSLVIQPEKRGGYQKNLIIRNAFIIFAENNRPWVLVKFLSGASTGLSSSTFCFG
jgi:hypothetical protein